MSIVSEFAAANHSRLQRIIELVERETPYDEPYTQLITEEPGQEPVFKNGAVTPEEVEKDSGLPVGLLNDEQKADLAQAKNAASIARAAIAFNTLRGIAGMALIVKDDQVEAPKIEAITDIPFQMAEWRHAEYYDEETYARIYTVAARLIEVKGLSQDVSLHTVQQEDSGLAETLGIISVGNAPVMADKRLHVMTDSLLSRCHIVFPDAFPVVMSILLSFRDLDENTLEDRLYDIWELYHGRAQEEIVDTLIDEVRVRALALKHGYTIEQETKANEPTLDYLDSIITMLES